MNKKWLVLIAGSLLCLQAISQTLFTYGKYQVDTAEFLRAYNKNNSQPVTNKAASVRDYLDLYINSRLKIREAYDRGFDTLPSLLTEVASLRSQIMDNYLIDPAILKRLTAEAFQRSLKDIHVAHIFISNKNSSGNIDTVSALQKMEAVKTRLKKGEDFLKVASDLSEDPSAKLNKGDIGFITVFTLPYEVENLVYATPVNAFSTVLRSRSGYHIFKTLEERKAVGKIKAQQILLAIPPNADENTKKALAAKADSLYKRLQAGDSFSKLATEFSNDYISAVNGGTLPDIGVGQYDPVFEKTLWALPKDGAFSKPFFTSHGWHIVKKVAAKPVITKPGDKSNEEDLQQRITMDGRWKASKEYIYHRVKSQPGLKKGSWNPVALWAYSDSILDGKDAGPGRFIKNNDVVFAIGDTAFTVSQWISYIQSYRIRPDGSGIKPYDELMQELMNNVMFSYYRDNLETYNDDFRYQMNEFRDGNLFFEIMQQQIWNKAQTDSAALSDLYEKEKKKYTWKQSADAVVFFCSEKSVAQPVYDEVKKGPANWHTITDNYSEKVIADSARYEWTQIPNLNNMTPVAGMITSPLINDNDNTASFAWIVKVYPQPMQRSFAEARGLVINDYQGVLENKWVEELKKKYPVIINQKLLAEISR